MTKPEKVREAIVGTVHSKALCDCIAGWDICPLTLDFNESTLFLSSHILTFLTFSPGRIVVRQKQNKKKRGRLSHPHIIHVPKWFLRSLYSRLRLTGAARKGKEVSVWNGGEQVQYVLNVHLDRFIWKYWGLHVLITQDIAEINQILKWQQPIRKEMHFNLDQSYRLCYITCEIFNSNNFIHPKWAIHFAAFPHAHKQRCINNY